MANAKVHTCIAIITDEVILTGEEWDAVEALIAHIGDTPPTKLWDKRRETDPLWVEANSVKRAVNRAKIDAESNEYLNEA